MKSFQVLSLFAICCLWMAPSVQACKKCSVDCTLPECMPYDISQQSVCTEVTHELPVPSQCQWGANGLYRHTDFQLLKGRIIAYKLQWFNQKWSSWFVPEYNDLDCKRNMLGQSCAGKPVCPDSLRKMWAYFCDHNHTYIICK
ncbi:hypothetical protein HELRODRAFT_168622 [Helobdella robusta]|uniref:C-type lectin domain-containing protein n=1 Tax=Helobdella robusta TaxID=6412 RepID=T1F0S8_HELRO|nr:hypothetical protein HELRODRAFT_168622 [Helobdella robusta]ESO09610.1 hypothetical protein HELRODRAFT_168622 [Helobdella robusta]